MDKYVYSLINYMIKHLFLIVKLIVQYSAKYSIHRLTIYTNMQNINMKKLKIKSPAKLSCRTFRYIYVYTYVFKKDSYIKITLYTMHKATMYIVTQLFLMSRLSQCIL